jgi:hypothetical protein
MSWQLTIINKYPDTLVPSVSSPIPKGDSRPVKLPQTLGNVYVNVPGLGAVNFIDVADKQIGGFSKATWGVLISYQGEEVIFRYEGGGQLELTINGFGQAELRGNGGFSQIRLSSFEITGSL